MSTNSNFKHGQSGNPNTQFQAGNRHRWQPGQSGNPTGVTRRRREFEERFHSALMEQGSAEEAARLLWGAARDHEPWAVQGPAAAPGDGRQTTERADPLIDGVVGKLPVTKQMSGVLADFVRSELIGWTVEITREILDDAQVSARGTFGVIATRDFIERHFSKMGHRDLLVTQITAQESRILSRPVHAKRLP